MHRWEKRFDQETTRQIRMDCQCGYGMDEKVKFVTELVSASSNMEGILYLKFLFCPCPILANVDKLETNTWCQCTTGYSKVLFEKAFGCEVKVELLKSIKMGSKTCLMKITPQDPISFANPKM